MSDYLKYRGKCKELAEELVEKNPELTLVRGHYFCPIWNTDEKHWWTVDKDGNVHDPTAEQFPSKGKGIYTPFDGMLICEECGKKITEDKVIFQGRFPCCSEMCAMRLVGLA